ncbi:hypothetical protein [Ideonella sp.]
MTSNDHVAPHTQLAGLDPAPESVPILFSQLGLRAQVLAAAEA